MVKVKFSGSNVGNTYQLRRVDKSGEPTGEVLVWCHKAYKGHMDEEKDYADTHEVTKEEAQKMAVHVRGGNLTLIKEKKKKEGK